jgi:hypothetical protein
MFTEEDAQNDGKIKKEAGSTMAQVAAKEGGELYDAFIEVCNESGQAPSEVLGDYLVRALNNEGFSERVLQTEIDMMTIRADELRKEDLEFVKEIADEFGLMPDNEPHPIRKLVERRLEAKGGGPLSSLSGGNGDSNGQGKDIDRLEARMNRMEGMLEQIAQDDEPVQHDTGGTAKSSRQSVDELFSGEEGNGSDGESEVVDDSDTVDMDGPPINVDSGVEGDEE